MTDNTSHRVTADELRQSDIAEATKEVLAEAKGRGYDPALMRKIVALRKRNSDDIANEECVMDTYKEALGM
jgi:uncharacterized protein (UPF0335 family)